MFSWPKDLMPKIWTVVFRARKYTGAPYGMDSFLKDLSAGTVVGIVALPLAIAFAIASGVKPEQGLFTAVVAGLTISLFSGSRQQIGGPTGAFVVIIYGIIEKFGYEGLAVATIIAGVLLVVMGLVRLGVIIQYIPHPVTVGFTSGIALIIFSGQVRDLIGLPMTSVPADFIEKWEAYAKVLARFDPLTLAVGVGTVVLIFLWPKVTTRVPGSIIAVVAGTAVVKLFDLPVDTIGSRFGTVAASLPAPTIPMISFAKVKQLISPAVSIALLAGIESLLSCVVADSMTGKKHRSNMELIGQGLANIASPLFGGIPATGAIARTATNVKNGGKTPVAGVVHALVLFLILVFLGKWASLIPMAVLAGILVVVAYHMSEWHMFVKLLKSPKSDVAVLVITFLLTVLVDLTVAIQVGVVLAAILFMKRMADVTQADFIQGEDASEDAEREGPLIPKDVSVYKINGPFFFGAAEKLKSTMSELSARAPRALIVNMSMVPVIDATGIQAMEEFVSSARKEKSLFLITGLQEQPRKALEQAGLLERIGEESVLPTISAAVRHVEDTRPVAKKAAKKKG